MWKVSVLAVGASWPIRWQAGVSGGAPHVGAASERSATRWDGLRGTDGIPPVWWEPPSPPTLGSSGSRRYERRCPAAHPQGPHREEEWQAEETGAG